MQEDYPPLNTPINTHRRPKIIGTPQNDEKRALHFLMLKSPPEKFRMESVLLRLFSPQSQHCS